MKDVLESICDRMDQPQERICSTEDRTLEITESQENKEKNEKELKKPI